MTLVDITKLANEATDENYSSELVKGFINQAIARINATLDAKLPFFSVSTDPYLGLSDNWIMLLLIPYAAFSIKTNDGSLNEASLFRQEYEVNFRLLEENRFKAIPEVYRNSNFGGIYQMDTSIGMNVGWFKKNSGGDW
jgi:hypothetical protein